jgi:glucokinase
MIGAVDIGGTKIAVGLVDDQGHVVSRSETPTLSLLEYATGLSHLSAELQRQAERTGSKLPLQGVGIGLTGRVDPRSGRLTENEFLPNWGLRDLGGDLGQRLGTGVAIENDADAAALGEARWGAGRGSQIFLYLTVSTGIGGGLVINGHLYRGSNGWHPEIGHQVVSERDNTCYCGAGGCWEQLASGPAIATWYQNQGGPQRTAGEICALARQDETLAQQAVAEGGYWLGLGIANLINLFAPDRIALGGGVMRSWDLFEPHARRIIARHCSFLVPHTLTEIVPAQLGNDAPLAGAACVWLHAHS